MKGGMQAAMTLGVGYVLGRPRKMRLATITAAAAAGGLGGLAVKRATKVLGSAEALGKLTPQLGELADVVRGDLMGAGKAAVTSRIESLTGSLQERAEVVGDPAAAASGASNPVRSAAGEAARSAGGAARRLWRRGQGAAGAEVADEPKDEGQEEPYFDEPDEPEGYQSGDGERESAPARRRRGPSGRLPRPGRPSRGEGRPQRTVHRRAGTRVGDGQ